jgi:Plasmid pRiA4b ORF-3-like protein
MPAPRVTVKTKIFELEIVLEQVQPSVRRRVQVPGEVSLAVLHEVVQSVMGWSNSHLHEFDIAGRRFGMPDPGWDDRDLTDEAKGKLFRLVKPGDRFGYLYDFGDNWVHRITVEKVAAAEPGVRYPRCVTGQGACPRRTSAARGVMTSSRRRSLTRDIPTTTNASSGRVGHSTRTASTSTRPTEPWSGWPGNR